MNRPALRAIAIATFFTLVPITLLVPGLTELVVDAHGGTRFQAHLFVSLNQLAGIVAVPVVLRLHRRGENTRAWLVALLLLDSMAFLGMRAADSLVTLFAWRAVDGLAHLPAVTLLMIAANRAGGRRRGASLGIVASALMVGVGVGAPLGGVLVDRDPALVYGVGAVLLRSRRPPRASCGCRVMPPRSPRPTTAITGTAGTRRPGCRSPTDSPIDS